MAQTSMDKLSVGQRVTLLTKHSGTIRYIGLIPFLPGICVGIELDETVGDNDGSVDNVRYFSCKKNHGHFCHTSEILREPSLSEIDFDVSSESTTFKSSELPIDLNILEEEIEIREVFSFMESSDDPKEDSDDSLGIMDLDFLTKSAEGDDIYLKDMPASYSFIDDTRADCHNLEHFSHLSAEQGKLNVTQVISSPENANLNLTQVISSPEKANLNLTQVISSPEEANLNLTQVISSPEETSLNLTQVIDSSEKQYNFNAAQTIMSDEQCDLNTTLVLNRTTEMEKKVSFDDGSHLTKVKSSIILSYIPILPDSKSGESPLHKTESSPKYASTPKHEVNYTFNLDEDYLNSEQNFSPVSHLDKKSIKHDAVKGKTVFPKNVEQDPENIFPDETYIKLPSDTDVENILNVTCKTEKFGDYHHELNKTRMFPHMVESDHDNILPSKTCIELSSDTDKKSTNAARTAEDLRDEEQFHDLNKTFDNFTLNTTMPVSKGSEKTIEESKNELNKTQTLNTTYEKKDQLTELPKIKKISKVNKQHEVQETRNTRKSKIAKSMDHSPSAIASNSKYSEFDKKKVRKSISLQNRNDNKGIPDKSRRKTFGSKSSLSDDIALSQSQNLSSNFDQKQDVFRGAISKTKTCLVRSPKKISCTKSEKCVMKGGTSIESMKTKSVKSDTRISTLIPQPSSRQTGESKSTLQEEQKFSFVDTINLTKSAPNTVRKVIKMLKVPSKRSSVAECEISKNSNIPSSLMPRPCSSKIEELVVQEEQKMSLDKFLGKLNQPVHEKVEISSLISRFSSRQTEESEATLQLNEPAPATERRVSEKCKIPSKRLSVAKCQSKISSIPSSLVPSSCSSKTEESKSTVQNEETFLVEAKKTIQSELNTGTTFDKPKKPPRRSPETKYEIPRAVMVEIPKSKSKLILTGKKSLPFFSNETAVKSAIKTKKETIHQSGFQEKRILSPSNQQNIRSDSSISTFPAPPKTARRQSLGNAGVIPNLRELWLPRPSQIKEGNNEDCAASQSSAAVRVPSTVQSHIPLSASRKKKDDEKSKLIPMAEKNRKKNNLR